MWMLLIWVQQFNGRGANSSRVTDPGVRDQTNKERMEVISPAECVRQTTEREQRRKGGEAEKQTAKSPFLNA